MKNQILLTGSSGKLGRAIIRSGKFQNLLIPPSNVLDICDYQKVDFFLKQNKIDAVIHAAGMARLVQSEKEPIEAIQKNIIGTSNIVMNIIKEQTKGNLIRFIHVSTDAVYPGTDGNYNENSPTIPKTKYGWSKLGAECAVNMLKNYCIVRTRFFDPGNIPFSSSADDIYTSKIPIDHFVEHIYVILHSDFIGTINIGGERLSDYECYKKYKPEITSCSRRNIANEVPFEIPYDISMDTIRLKKIQIKK